MIKGVGVRNAKYLISYCGDVERIFKTPKGKIPSIIFSGKPTQCKVDLKNATCNIKGYLSLRGKRHPLTLPITLKKKGESYVLKGKTEIKLSNYKILNLNNNI